MVSLGDIASPSELCLVSGKMFPSSQPGQHMPLAVSGREGLGRRREEERGRGGGRRGGQGGEGRGA